MITRIKGSQDFIDISLLQYAITATRTHLSRYHFDEIITPILESTELFNRSLGTSTDAVSKEMFIIKSLTDPDTICLRPEATASTVRAFVENGISTTPWKVFSCGPMFRYERPQKGRYREFRQITIEMIGAASTTHDAHLIIMLDRLFSEQFKLNNYALSINFLGCLHDRQTYTAALKHFLLTIQDKICALCAHRTDKNTLRVLDCKNESCQALYADAPQLLNHLCNACNIEWQQVQEQLTLLSVSFIIQPRLVRGLDYYNKTVFEFSSPDLGSQSAFCGGGRYDQLVKEIGGKQDEPSVGAAIGVERLLLLLEPIKDQLPLPTAPAVHVIIPLSTQQHIIALLLADDLQAKGHTVDILCDGSLKSMMRKANKMGAQYALLLGEEEQKTHTVTLKHMITGDTQTIAQSAVAQWLKK